MLARMLRKILLFQATSLALISAAVARLAGWPAWAGLVIFAVLPLLLVMVWVLKITAHACQGLAAPLPKNPPPKPQPSKIHSTPHSFQP